MRYTCQPTGTSCLSSRRPATLPASPTQSPTKTTVTATAGSAVLGAGGGTSSGSRRGSRKHVQFPDFDAPSLKSTDLLHANWKQGSSPPPEQSTSMTPGYTPSGAISLLIELFSTKTFEYSSVIVSFITVLFRICLIVSNMITVITCYFWWWHNV